MDMVQVVKQAKEKLSGITGLTPVAATGSFKDGQGWHVGVEMLEMSRIPPATDVLGCYEVSLSEGGDLLGFERKRTRLRGEISDGDRVA